MIKVFGNVNFAFRYNVWRGHVPMSSCLSCNCCEGPCIKVPAMSKHYEPRPTLVDFYDRGTKDVH